MKPIVCGAIAGAICLPMLSWTIPVHAQAAAPEKKAFCVIELKVTDPEMFKGYSSKVQATMDPYGGRYVARRGKVASLEGEPPAGAAIISAWPSLEKAQEWYNSAAYKEII